MKKYLMIIAALAISTLFAQANDMEQVKAAAQKAVQKSADTAPVQKQAEEKTAKTLEKKVDEKTAEKQ